jgi:hypothetical protein
MKFSHIFERSKRNALYSRILSVIEEEVSGIIYNFFITRCSAEKNCHSMENSHIIIKEAYKRKARLKFFQKIKDYAKLSELKHKSLK